MPLCPSCEAEYEASVRVCPECDTALVDHLESRGSSEDLVDVFVCYDAQVAERVMEVLQEGGVTPMVRDLSSQAFPTSMGRTGARNIAVPESQAEKARRLLADAEADGIVDRQDGELA